MQSVNHLKQRKIKEISIKNQVTYSQTSLLSFVFVFLPNIHSLPAFISYYKRIGSFVSCILSLSLYRGRRIKTIDLGFQKPYTILLKPSCNWLGFLQALVFVLVRAKRVRSLFNLGISEYASICSFPVVFKLHVSLHQFSK